MKLFYCLAVLFISSLPNGQCQSRFIDSIIALRHMDSLPGKIKVYYTPGYRKNAERYQHLFTGATRFYEQHYRTGFKYKVAILDSAQWITEKYPFGLLAYDSGWLFIPAVVKAPFFQKIHGLDERNVAYSAFLKQHRLTTQKISDDFYLTLSLHELGHYFTIDNMHAVMPDMFAAELIATYFAYAYLQQSRHPALKTLVDYSVFAIDQYQPQYRHISALDSLFVNMPIQNFRWFHRNIVLLAQRIYDVHGLSFIDYFLHTFKEGGSTQFTTQQVIELLDKKCNGIVDRWVNEMTSGAPK